MARKKKQKPRPSGPKGAPEWVVTFTDMISLLVTFFVLLMTFSSMVDHDVLKVESLLDRKRGVMKNDGQMLPETPNDDLIAATDIERGALQPHTRPADELPDSLAEMGQKDTPDHVEVDMNAARDGLVIEFGPKEAFLPGSATVTEELRRALGEIGGVLEHYPNLVVVEGSTDGEEGDPAGELAFERASAAAEVLLAESRLPSELVQTASVVARDDGPATPESRRANRRVQLRVVALSRLRASYLEARELEEREGR